jgi:hypothetical protein
MRSCFLRVAQCATAQSNRFLGLCGARMSWVIVSIFETTDPRETRGKRDGDAHSRVRSMVCPRAGQPHRGVLINSKPHSIARHHRQPWVDAGVACHIGTASQRTL